MEKKTIGKFISALRRANGMTQKELGDKLFVSDKTVSRWERDECTPELALIPAIAEIFGITADELLRGEKNSPDDDADEQKIQRQKAKSEKQFQLMLDTSKKKYDNYTLISVGIAFFGAIAANICNSGFYNGVLGLGLEMACFLASFLCQCCFVNNCMLPLQEEHSEYFEKIQEYVSYIAREAIKFFIFDILILAFCAPMGLFASATTGLSDLSWFILGLAFVAGASIILYIVWHLGLKEKLVNSRIIIVSDKEKTVMAVRKKMLKRCLIVFCTIALVLITALFVMLESGLGYALFLKRQTVDSPEEFVAFMQDEYDRWFHEGYDPIKDEMSEQEYLELYESEKDHYALVDSKTGKHYEFYYTQNEYNMMRVDYDVQSGKVTFMSNQAGYYAGGMVDIIGVSLLIAIAASAVVCTTVYAVTVIKAKRK